MQMEIRSLIDVLATYVTCCQNIFYSHSLQLHQRSSLTAAS